MSEIKDKIATLINNGRVNGIPTYEVIDQILLISQLAIVDRETELPSIYEIQRHFTGLSWSTCENLRHWLSKELESWVKEVKDV